MFYWKTHPDTDECPDILQELNKKTDKNFMDDFSSKTDLPITY